MEIWFKQKIGLEWTMNGLEKLSRKNSDPKILKK